MAKHRHDPFVARHDATYDMWDELKKPDTNPDRRSGVTWFGVRRRETPAHRVPGYFTFKAEGLVFVPTSGYDGTQLFTTTH